MLVQPVLRGHHLLDRRRIVVRPVGRVEQVHRVARRRRVPADRSGRAKRQRSPRRRVHDLDPLQHERLRPRRKRSFRRVGDFNAQHGVRARVLVLRNEPRVAAAGQQQARRQPVGESRAVRGDVDIHEAAQVQAGVAPRDRAQPGRPQVARRRRADNHAPHLEEVRRLLVIARHHLDAGRLRRLARGVDRPAILVEAGIRLVEHESARDRLRQVKRHAVEGVVDLRGAVPIVRAGGREPDEVGGADRVPVRADRPLHLDAGDREERVRHVEDVRERERVHRRDPRHAFHRRCRGRVRRARAVDQVHGPAARLHVGPDVAAVEGKLSDGLVAHFGVEPPDLARDAFLPLLRDRPVRVGNHHAGDVAGIGRPGPQLVRPFGVFHPHPHVVRRRLGNGPRKVVDPHAAVGVVARDREPGRSVIHGVAQVHEIRHACRNPGNGLRAAIEPLLGQRRVGMPGRRKDVNGRHDEFGRLPAGARVGLRYNLDHRLHARRVGDVPQVRVVPVGVRHVRSHQPPVVRAQAAGINRYGRAASLGAPAQRVVLPAPRLLAGRRTDARRARHGEVLVGVVAEALAGRLHTNPARLRGKAGVGGRDHPHVGVGARASQRRQVVHHDDRVRRVGLRNARGPGVNAGIVDVDRGQAVRRVPYDGVRLPHVPYLVGSAVRLHHAEAPDKVERAVRRVLQRDVYQVADAHEHVELGRGQRGRDPGEPPAVDRGGDVGCAGHDVPRPAAVGRVFEPHVPRHVAGITPPDLVRHAGQPGVLVRLRPVRLQDHQPSFRRRGLHPVNIHRLVALRMHEGLEAEIAARLRVDLVEERPEVQVDVVARARLKSILRDSQAAVRRRPLAAALVPVEPAVARAAVARDLVLHVRRAVAARGPQMVKRQQVPGEVERLPEGGLDRRVDRGVAQHVHPDASQNGRIPVVERLQYSPVLEILPGRNAAEKARACKFREISRSASAGPGECIGQRQAVAGARLELQGHVADAVVVQRLFRAQHPAVERDGIHPAPERLRSVVGLADLQRAGVPDDHAGRQRLAAQFAVHEKPHGGSVIRAKKMRPVPHEQRKRVRTCCASQPERRPPLGIHLDGVAADRARPLVEHHPVHKVVRPDPRLNGELGRLKGCVVRNRHPLPGGRELKALAELAAGVERGAGNGPRIPIAAGIIGVPIQMPQPVKPHVVGGKRRARPMRAPLDAAPHHRLPRIYDRPLERAAGLDGIPRRGKFADLPVSHRAPGDQGFIQVAGKVGVLCAVLGKHQSGERGAADVSVQRADERGARPCAVHVDVDVGAPPHPGHMVPAVIVQTRHNGRNMLEPVDAVIQHERHGSCEISAASAFIHLERVVLHAVVTRDQPRLVRGGAAEPDRCGEIHCAQIRHRRQNDIRVGTVEVPAGHTRLGAARGIGRAHRGTVVGLAGRVGDRRAGSPRGFVHMPQAAHRGVHAALQVEGACRRRLHRRNVVSVPGGLVPHKEPLLHQLRCIVHERVNAGIAVRNPYARHGGGRVAIAFEQQPVLEVALVRHKETRAEEVRIVCARIAAGPAVGRTVQGSDRRASPGLESGLACNLPAPLLELTHDLRVGKNAIVEHKLISLSLHVIASDQAEHGIRRGHAPRNGNKDMVPPDRQLGGTRKAIDVDQGPGRKAHRLQRRVDNREIRRRSSIKR